MRMIYGTAAMKGRGIRVDPICRRPKVCTYNCVYCLFGRKGMRTSSRSKFMDARQFGEELASLPDPTRIRSIQFSGTGDPTLASNIGELAKAAKYATAAKVALLTNGSLLTDPSVRAELLNFDGLVIRIDAGTERTFEVVNDPNPNLNLATVLEGLRLMRYEFPGSFQILVTFLARNKPEAPLIADVCRELRADAVYLTTPSSTTEQVRPLKMRELKALSQHFHGLDCSIVSDDKTLPPLT
jgi:wyosine [tRNA(Phe)-imidazoG37] synthetase (radical SAM superfamily)